MSILFSAFSLSPEKDADLDTLDNSGSWEIAVDEPERVADQLPSCVLPIRLHPARISLGVPALRTQSQVRGASWLFFPIFLSIISGSALHIIDCRLK